MTLRRHFLQAGAVLPIGTALPAAARRGPLARDEAAAHVLNRLGFGPAPGDLAAVAPDPAGWIAAQLAPSALPLPASLTAKLREADFVETDPIDAVRGLLDAIDESRRSPAADGEPSAVVRHVRVAQRPVLESRLFRALESPRQLEEAMVDFWFNHFNVFQGKNLLRVLVGHYEHHAIRPHALGRFRDLLGAVAHHPAMLYYLDNWTSAGEQAGSGRGLNENYARELMELHTLGVDGGYTQADVTQLARMLTGWTIVPPRRAGVAPPADRATPGFWFNGRIHDRGAKAWLGRAVEARGKAEGDYALDVLAAHPATARHIAFKLAQYFVADRPPAALVDRLAGVFAAEDGRIVPVLRALFGSDEFWDPAHAGSKFKTPYHYALSVVRAVGAKPQSALPLAGALAAQGMPLYGCATPEGYKNTEAAWLSPDAMTRRIAFATQVARLANGQGLDALLATVGPLATPATRGAAEEARQQPELALALVLGGPGMMRR